MGREGVCVCGGLGGEAVLLATFNPSVQALSNDLCTNTQVLLWYSHSRLLSLFADIKPENKTTNCRALPGQEGGEGGWGLGGGGVRQLAMAVFKPRHVNARRTQ